METPRLILRPISETDLADYIKLLSNPEVMRFIGLAQGRTFSEEEVLSLIHGAMRVWRERGYGRWSMFERATGEFVGFAGFRSEQDVPELLTIVHEKFWRTGYAFEGCKAALDYGFRVFKFDEICSFTRPANHKARGLLDKLGCEFLGIIDFHGVDAAAYRIQPA